MESLPVRTEVRWRDYSANAFDGDVFTLTVSAGRYLLAALAVFITLVSASTWGIISFTLHQLRVKDETSADGLYFQIQTLLRHPSSPLTAVKDLVSLGWAWRSRSNKSRVRQLKSRLFVLALPALVTFVSFAAAGIFVSRVAQFAYQSNDVVLRPTRCGAWSFNLSVPAERAIAQDKNANDTRNARAYAQNCYEQGSKSGVCSIYPTTAIIFNSSDVSCPFGPDPDGEDACLYRQNQAMQLDTGLLSSNQIFGINTGPTDQIQVRKVVTCSPFHATNYVNQSLSSQGGYTIWNFDLGRLSGDVLSNYTYSYNTYGRQANIGFSLYSVSTIDQTWQPVRAIRTMNADLSAHFLSQNTVVYEEQVHDIWFSATRTDGVVPGYYGPSEYTNVLVCAEQHQLVNPDSGARSSLSTIQNLAEIYQQLGFNSFQEAIATRFLLSFTLSSIFNVVTTLGSSALLASDRLTELVGTTLPDDQWQIEVRAWFETSLARAQWSVVDYNINANLNELGSVVLPSKASQNPVDLAQNELCSLQRIRNTGSYQTFSFWGIIITVSLGIMLIVISWTLEWCVKKFRQVRSGHPHREVAHISDNKYQLLRKNLRVALPNNHNMTEDQAWDDILDIIPVAKAGVEFFIPEKTLAGDYQYHHVIEDGVESGLEQPQDSISLRSRLPIPGRGSAAGRPNQARGGGEAEVLLSNESDVSWSHTQRPGSSFEIVDANTEMNRPFAAETMRTRTTSTRVEDEDSI